MKACLYARISRAEDGAIGESIDNQLTLLSELARGQGYDIVDKAFDNNVSGTIFDRPGLNRVLDGAKRGTFDTLFVKDLSRLGRNNGKTLLLLEQLEDLNIRVVTADLRYDSHKDNEITGLETWYNERYIRDISNKTRATIRALQQRGLALGRAPFGYKKVNKYFFEPDNSQAEIVRLIFNEFIDGKKISEIAGSLGGNERGWSTQRVRRILKNQAYIGTLVSGKTERRSFKNKKQVKREKQIVTLNHHEAIVDEELFFRANKMLEVTKKGDYDKKGPLRNLLFCGACGAPMYRRSVGGRWGYVCSTYCRYGRQRCERNYIEETFVLSELEKKLEVEIKSRFNTAKQQEIIRLEDKLERAYWQFLNDEIDDELYKKIQKKIELIKKDISSKIIVSKDLFHQISKIEVINPTSLRIHLSM